MFIKLFLTKKKSIFVVFSLIYHKNNLEIINKPNNYKWRVITLKILMHFILEG